MQEHAFRLDRDGVWLVKAVQMDHAPQGTGADWESFWASVVFQIRVRRRSGTDAG